jgi:arylsulfatase
MVDRMDQNIGRVLDDLHTTGQLDNTLVIFLSDNGACAEWDPWGFDGSSGPKNVLHRGADLDAMGGPGSYLSYGSGWANAGNTPWRLYKHYVHEGGISSPFIVHWPGEVKRRGAIDSATVAHLIDLLPTCAEAAGADPPRQVNGHDVLPAEGMSLIGLFRGFQDESRPIPASRKVLYWEHEGNRAVREGNWKLVGLHSKPWELYDIVADRSEMHDFAAAQPERVKEMAAKYDAWATRCNVRPWPVTRKENGQ